VLSSGCECSVDSVPLLSFPGFSGLIWFVDNILVMLIQSLRSILDESLIFCAYFCGT
jgi:hypothetical protein